MKWATGGGSGLSTRRPVVAQPGAGNAGIAPLLLGTWDRDRRAADPASVGSTA